MSQSLTITSTVINGRLEPKRSALLRAMISRFDGGKVRIELSEAKSRRSLVQNGYWWAVVVKHVVAMFEENGTALTPDDAHEFLKLHVLKLNKIITGLDGSVAIIGGSTAALSKTEFADAVAKVQAWAAGFGWHIPDPSEFGDGDDTIRADKK